jgi:hypothetical protein
VLGHDLARQTPAWSSRGLESLAQVARLRPEPSNFESIRRGLERLHEGMKGTPEERDAGLEREGHRRSIFHTKKLRQRVDDDVIDLNSLHQR